jgi:hypothetical protein
MKTLIKYLSFVVLFIYPIFRFWNISSRYTKYTYDINDLYLQKVDFEIITNLIEFEKTIPKDQKIWVFPTPAYFYLFTGRMNPLYQSVYVRGFELIDSDQIRMIDDLKSVDWILIEQLWNYDFYDAPILGISGTFAESCADGYRLSQDTAGDLTLVKEYILANYEEITDKNGLWLLKRRSNEKNSINN